MKEIKIRQIEDQFDLECDLENISEASDKSEIINKIKTNKENSLKTVGFYETMPLGGTLKKDQLANQFVFGQSKVSGMNLELIDEGNEFNSDEKLKSSNNTPFNY